MQFDLMANFILIQVDNLGRNFLHVAVQTMNREALFFLIQVNAHLDVRIKDAYQYTPLHLAIISGAPEDMIRSLVSFIGCLSVGDLSHIRF